MARERVHPGTTAVLTAVQRGRCYSPDGGTQAQGVGPKPPRSHTASDLQLLIWLRLTVDCSAVPLRLSVGVSGNEA